MADIEGAFHFLTENNRTYHGFKDKKYVLPNDQLEQNRLNFQHQALLVTFHNKLGYAPPNEHDNPNTRVLDIGTGTGIWAIDYAQRHPHHEVIGVDLSPIQPKDAPANASWKVVDVDDQWSYDKPFEYIHGRFLNGSIPDWEHLLTDVYNNLSPGGWFEIQNIDINTHCDDGTLKPDHKLVYAFNLLIEGTSKLGRPFIESASLVPIMKKIGFKHVQMLTFRWPFNEWPKDAHLQEVGRLTRLNIGGGLEGLLLGGLTRGCGWTAEQVEELAEQAREQMNNDKSQHGYFLIMVITGQKE